MDTKDDEYEIDYSRWTSVKITEELKDNKNRPIGYYKFDEEYIKNVKRPKGPLKPIRNFDPIEDRIYIALSYAFIKIGDGILYSKMSILKEWRMNLIL